MSEWSIFLCQICRDSPLYPGQHCCNKPQSSLAQFLPSGYSFSSLGIPSFSVPGLSSSSAVGPVASSSFAISSQAQQSSRRQHSSYAQHSSYTQHSSQVGINYQSYTTIWIYYYVVWYVTFIQESPSIASSTTTTTTTLMCYAANSRAAASQFSTLEATITAQATSLQASISSSLFASHGQASASAAAGGGSAGSSIRVDTVATCLLVLGGLLPGILAVVL